jgi:hypothetical protein
MRRALLAVVLLLAGCGAGGVVTTGGPIPADLEARITKVQDDLQVSIRYFNKQYNSCTVPNQWFPATDCVMTSEQLVVMKTTIENDSVQKINAAIRYGNAWRSTHDPEMQTLLLSALDEAEKSLKSLGVPNL